MMKRNRDLAAVYLEGLALLLLGLALLGGSRFMSSAASSSSSAASLSTSSSCLNDGTMMDTSTTASNECLVSNDVASASSILAQSLTGGASEDDGNSGGVSSSEASFTSPAPKTTAGLGADMGEPQLLDSTYSNEIMDRIDEARRYLQKTVMVDDEKKYAKTKDICVNKHQSCAFCGVLGECEKNPGYMKVNCAPVCKSCEMLHVETRCPMDPEATDALYPGDLDAMFERISTAEEFQQYEPTVVSRPPEGPWMIIFDNAISDEEADALIRLGGELGYERSADVGEEKADGTYTKKINNRRTSTNAWCVDDCYSDPIAQRVMQRIENITGIPEANSENLQLLRYEQSQFYQTHSDYIPYQLERPTGVRILTFYMYLNDVEEGGGTNFPALNVTATPRKGRAVLWPSVLNEDPNKIDRRTNHQALPVLKGVKYGANSWIHMRDFKTPNKLGC